MTATSRLYWNIHDISCIFQYNGIENGEVYWWDCLFGSVVFVNLCGCGPPFGDGGRVVDNPLGDVSRPLPRCNFCVAMRDMVAVAKEFCDEGRGDLSDEILDGGVTGA